MSIGSAIYCTALLALVVSWFVVPAMAAIPWWVIALPFIVPVAATTVVLVGIVGIVWVSSITGWR